MRVTIYAECEIALVRKLGFVFAHPDTVPIFPITISGDLSGTVSWRLGYIILSGR